MFGKLATKMRRSLESLSRSSNIDMGKDPEGINSRNNNVNKPDTFEEHMRRHGSLLNYLNDILGEDTQETTTKNEEHEQAVNEAREAVLKAFNGLGDKGKLLADTEALHMNSSGIVDPIPMSEVRAINGIESMSDEELRDALKKGELNLSDISSTF